MVEKDQLRGTTSNFGRDRHHREELCKSVNLKNATRVRQSLRIRNFKLCNKNDAPAQKRGTWRELSWSSKRGTWPRSTPYQRSNPLRKSQRSENSFINAHAKQTGLKLMRTGTSKGQEPHNGSNCQWSGPANDQTFEGEKNVAFCLFFELKDTLRQVTCYSAGMLFLVQRFVLCLLFTFGIARSALMRSTLLNDASRWSLSFPNFDVVPRTIGECDGATWCQFSNFSVE